ncbi:MAG TPA: phosphoribosyltransferase family protein [Acidimicrobiales bacterium]|jgi:putative phosphoribosyl transferase|nr:phosphoribosyltransferase family protein [Acidimicrobiales bacterium]
MVRFIDRRDAGRQLAAKLVSRPALEGSIVFGLPRGGVPVAYEVAVSLTLPLDVLVVRKIGVPTQPELAMGALAEADVVVVDREVMAMAHVSPMEFAAVETRERTELERRIALFRGDRTLRPLDGLRVIIVDDGVATGATSRAACRVARVRGAAHVLLAVPVTSARTVDSLRLEADEIFSLVVVEGSFSVGQSYRHFDQTSDEEVVACLSQASLRGPPFS